MKAHARQVVVDSGCLDCPFTWAFGENEDEYRCSLVPRALLASRYIGVRHDDGKIRDRRGRVVNVIATPKWCPLRTRPALVTLKARRR